MKFSVLFLALIFSVSAFATSLQPSELFCVGPGKSPIQQIDLSMYEMAEGYTAVIMPVCLVCMVRPTYVHFASKELKGTQMIYSGDTAQMVIHLESLLPQTSYPATLTLKEKDGDQVYQFSCEF